MRHTLVMSIEIRDIYCNTRVCSCNIFNRRASEAVGESTTLTYWAKILQWLWGCMMLTTNTYKTKRLQST